MENNGIWKKRFVKVKRVWNIKMRVKWKLKSLANGEIADLVYYYSQCACHSVCLSVCPIKSFYWSLAQGRVGIHSKAFAEQMCRLPFFFYCIPIQEFLEVVKVLIFSGVCYICKSGFFFEFLTWYMLILAQKFEFSGLNYPRT